MVKLLLCDLEVGEFYYSCFLMLQFIMHGYYGNIDVSVTSFAFIVACFAQLSSAVFRLFFLWLSSLFWVSAPLWTLSSCTRYKYVNVFFLIFLIFSIIIH